MSTLDAVPAPVPGVVGRIVDDEAVLVLPEQGKVKVLNEVGARMWALTDGARSVREIALLICDEYDVEPETAEADTLDFLRDLEARGAIEFSRPAN
jgi:hypothetical protein